MSRGRYRASSFQWRALAAAVQTRRVRFHLDCGKKLLEFTIVMTAVPLREIRRLDAPKLKRDRDAVE